MIARVDARHQAELSVVCDLNGFIERLEGGQEGHWTEHFLSGDSHRGPNAGKKCGSDEKAGRQTRVSRQLGLSGDRGTLFLSQLDIAQHALLVRLRHQRAHVSGPVRAVADLEASHGESQSCNELVM